MIIEFILWYIGMASSIFIGIAWSAFLLGHDMFYGYKVILFLAISTAVATFLTVKYLEWVMNWKYFNSNHQ